MDGLTLLRPLWLAALLPCAGLIAMALWRVPDAGGWQKVMPPEMLRAMRALGMLGGWQPLWQRLLAPAGLAMLVCGLAGPAVPRADAPVLAQTDAVLLAVDMSPSVAQGAALEQAQVAAAGLAQLLAGRPVGMILFGGEAYAVAAPTLDSGSLQTQIAVLDADTMPDRGSRPAAALGLAGQMLAGLRRADLVLISDGGGIDAAARAEADRIAGQGARISAVRLTGTAPGAPQPADDALRSLLRGGGHLVTADQVPRLAASLDRGGATRRDPVLQALRYRDFGPFLAALAGLPLLVMLLRQR